MASIVTLNLGLAEAVGKEAEHLVPRPPMPFLLLSASGAGGFLAPNKYVRTAGMLGAKQAQPKPCESTEGKRKEWRTKHA